MADINSLVDKATSPLLLDIDWDNTLQIVDSIRQGDIPAKNAINALLIKIHDTNPNVVLLALQVLESVVKNCGEAVHELVASRDFMEEVRDLLKRATNEDVQKKITMMLSTWVYAFRSQSKYSAVQDTVNILKAEGYNIPSAVESDAMFRADAAPTWSDGDTCHRCRSNFHMLRRKHHCRACGQVFCSDCSGKSSTIPKFGIEREVRVCHHCFEHINSPAKAAPTQTAASGREGAVSNDVTSKSSSGQKSAEELREEEELQLALALSKSEAENKEKEKIRATYAILGHNWRQPVAPAEPQLPQQQVTAEEDDLASGDPELAKYLNRSYWEGQRQKQQAPKEDAKPAVVKVSELTQQNGLWSNDVVLPASSSHLVSSSSPECETFVRQLRGQLEIFTNRLRSNQMRGRPLANDTAVQSIFMTVTAMHTQLLSHIQQQDQRRLHFEQLQDKIAQIHDARAALDALREDHREKLRCQKEEQDRIRQAQMMQKLDIMRKKKQEYLEYQRQVALRRMAESERQMIMGAGNPMGGPPVQVGPVPPVQGMPPQPFVGPQSPQTGFYGYAPPGSEVPFVPYQHPQQPQHPQHPPQPQQLPQHQPPTTVFGTVPNPEFAHFPVSAGGGVPFGAAPPAEAPPPPPTLPQPQEEAPLISFD